MAVIDAHQHVWDPTRARYDWLGPDLSPIDRPIGFPELVPSLTRAGVDATVLVQSADNRDDTELMLETAQAHPQIVAVVAFAPLEHADEVRRLAETADRTLVVGVRNLIHEMADPDFLLRADVGRGLRVLEQTGLTLDVVSVLPRHLEHVPVIARRFPELRIVVDHLSKPPIGAEDVEPWWSLIAAAAEPPNVFAKVSGLYSSVGPADSWSSTSIEPFVSRAVDLFGPERLMFGGDWPISLVAGGYDRVWDALSLLVGRLGDAGSSAILGGTAERFYGIDPARLATAVSLR